jgi:hypothetical protein
MGTRVVVALPARHNAHLHLAASQMERQIGQNLACRGMVREREAVDDECDPAASRFG